MFYRKAHFLLAVFIAALVGASGSHASVDMIAAKAYVDDGLASKANTADLAPVATSGSYNDLSGRPTLGTAAAANASDFATAAQGVKADNAVQRMGVETIGSVKT
ncbi:MAG: hypothetical protein FWF34_00800, partial [Alphaproteobacteria bacterium]|nr:hypothetical protein [Alphaproteobacteria bacterium]